MKARNILIGIAVLLFLINSLPYFSGNIQLPQDRLENKIAYLLGYNAFILIGLIFLMIAFFVHKKVRRKQRKKMLDSFLE